MWSAVAILLVSSLAGSAAATVVNRAQSADLPVVDLGYAIQQATGYNETYGYYNFSNIRFGQSPTGDLRWKKPLAPTGRNTTVDDGSIGRVCPEVETDATVIAELFVEAYLTGQSFNYTETEEYLASINATHFIIEDGRFTEDCLFLDVMVPEGIFDGRSNETEECGSSNSTGAPVMVWIHGGGYVGGSKSDTYNSAGLLAASQADGSDGMIWVSMNYRLGVFGFSFGPEFEAAGGDTNAALYDQRLALQWVQDNIHLFGGDPNQVTVAGESAGGGCIMHHITAYGGTGPSLFKRAIVQSPAFQPLVDPGPIGDSNLAAFLSLLNVSTLAEANELSSSALQLANREQVQASFYGTNTYGPVIDGDLVPDLPGLLLLEGAFDSSIEVMVGHNSDEGIGFTDPRIVNNAVFVADVSSLLPNASNASLTYITETLYPPVFDGSYGYTDEYQRYALLIGEAAITCNTDFLARAFDNQTYNYQFAVFPGVHGQDVSFTYYTGNVTANPIATAMQEYFTSFVETGLPRGDGLPVWPVQGNNATELVFGDAGIYTQVDETVNSRCRWWQLALFGPDSVPV